MIGPGPEPSVPSKSIRDVKVCADRTEVVRQSNPTRTKAFHEPAFILPPPVSAGMVVLNVVPSYSDAALRCCSFRLHLETVIRASCVFSRCEPRNCTKGLRCKCEQQWA